MKTANSNWSTRHLLSIVLVTSVTAHAFAQENETKVNMNHISVNANPNFFYFFPQHDRNYTGISIIPELEYSRDFTQAQNLRWFASIFSNNVTSLTSTSGSSSSSNSSSNGTIISASKTSILGMIGIEVNLLKSEPNTTVSSSIIQKFAVGFGYGNLYTGNDDQGNSVYQQGYIFMVAFKVSAISFNF